MDNGVEIGGKGLGERGNAEKIGTTVMLHKQLKTKISLKYFTNLIKPTEV